MAERQLLRFPSQFLHEDRTRRLHGLCDMELSLRRGQANDSLHKLTELISTKSWMFRVSIRPSRTQSKKTRAWGPMHRLEQRIQVAAATYRASRAAMLLLDMTPTDRSTYKKLEAEDLKASTAIADPNSAGERHRNLSWIWRLDVHTGEEPSQDLIEGEKPLDAALPHTIH